MLDGIRAYLREIKHTKKSHKGNFYKKFLLNPQKLLLFGNIVAKERKVLRDLLQKIFQNFLTIKP